MRRNTTAAQKGQTVVRRSADGPTAIFTTTIRARQEKIPFKNIVGRIISFFRKDAPIPIVISRTKLALGILLLVITPLVLGLSAVVFQSDRRYR